MSFWNKLFGVIGVKGSSKAASGINPDIITVIEADGLFWDLPTGLVGSEQVNLSNCFLTYAIGRGVEGPPEAFDSIRAEAKKKYPTAAQQTKTVLEALDLLLLRSRLSDYNKAIVSKTKTALAAR